MMKFRFRTDDDLPYNQKINVPVSVIPLSSVIKRKKMLVIQILDYKNVFMKLKIKKKNY